VDVGVNRNGPEIIVFDVNGKLEAVVTPKEFLLYDARRKPRARLHMSQKSEYAVPGDKPQPPDLQPGPPMDTDFAVMCPLVQHRIPQIQFLYIGSRFCFALSSDFTSR
jgi:hypothetical protein